MKIIDGLKIEDNSVKKMIIKVLQERKGLHKVKNPKVFEGKK